MTVATRVWGAAAVLAAAGLITLGSATAVGAQDDPYGSTTTSTQGSTTSTTGGGTTTTTGGGTTTTTGGGTTTTVAPNPGGFSPTIDLSFDVGPNTATVGVRACNYDPADAGLAATITFAGEPVANGTINTSGCVAGATAAAGSEGALGVGEAAAAFQVTELAQTGFEVSAAVPNLRPGTYSVCSVAAGYGTPCHNFRIVAGAGVAGDGDERSRGGSGALARTGVTIAVLLAVALALLVIGRASLEASRRRRRADATAATARRAAAVDPERSPAAVES